MKLSLPIPWSLSVLLILTNFKIIYLLIRMLPDSPHLFQAAWVCAKLLFILRGKSTLVYPSPTSPPPPLPPPCASCCVGVPFKATTDHFAVCSNDQSSPCFPHPSPRSWYQRVVAAVEEILVKTQVVVMSRVTAPLWWLWQGAGPQHRIPLTCVSYPKARPR